MFQKAGVSGWRSSVCAKSLRVAAALGVAIAGVAVASGGTGAAGAPADAAFWSWVIAPAGAVLGLFFAFVFFRQMLKVDEGTEKMRAIAGYVREGANAYLKRQYKVVAIVFAGLFALFVVISALGMMRPLSPVMFLLGGFFSGLSGWIGMRAATQASARTANMARQSLNSALKVAFRSGSVMGLVVVGFGLLNIAVWYVVLLALYKNNTFGLGKGMNEEQILQEVTGTLLIFGIGASTMALFARVGGGIYTKSADVGADLVGKIEAGIPEDDPRNPATIADNVGDNVGDVAGMGADLYESYVGSILATSALAAAMFATLGPKAVLYILAPMTVAGLGIILSVVGIFFVRCKEDASQKNLLRALLSGTFGATVLIALAVAGMVAVLGLSWGILGAVLAGLIAGVIIGQSTEWYTSDAYRWTRGIAAQTEMGPAPTVIEGIAVGMLSSAIPVVTIVVGIIAAFGLAGGFSGGANAMNMGLYGVAFAAVGMLSTLGITLATDAYGPVADNAGGNAEMSGLPPEVRERTDALDALGNTTAATGKGFAIGSAALTAMGLLAAYMAQLVVSNPQLRTMEDALAAYRLEILNPALLGGLFIGAMMVFVFCGMTMRAVGRTAGKIVAETRRQFALIRKKLRADGMTEEQVGNPDNWPERVEVDGQTVPDYAECVTIATAGAQKEMVIPALLAIFVPLIVGLLLGVPGVLGLLTGSLAAGLSMACMLNNAGGAWDNAKKWIEKGNMGGKRSPAHKAAVVGDTVGDPCKDTSGPSLNILLKLMAMVSVAFCGVVLRFSPMVQDLLHMGGN